MFKNKSLALALLSLNLIITYSYAKQPSSLVLLPTPGYTLIENATFIKPVEDSKKLTFSVWLKLRNKSKLDKLVEEIYDPRSSNYQKFLNREIFEEQYAPLKEVEHKIQEYFIAQGMQAHIVNHSVQVTALVQQMERVLHTRFNYYLFDNKTVYATTNKPSLPHELAQHIIDITGLNNIPLYHFNQVSAERGTPFYNTIEEFIAPNALPTTTSLTGFSGAQLQYTYNIDNIPPIKGTHIDGKGQTLIIVDTCGKYSTQQILSDANQYFSANGIKPFFMSGPSRNFAILNHNLTPYTTCHPIDPGANGENALDIESSHTLAPGGNTILVIANGDFAVGALQNVIGYITANNFTLAGFSNAYVISNSWGISESSLLDPNTSLEQSLQTAAAFGISLQFSAGDCGDNTYTSAHKDPKSKKEKCQNKGKTKSVLYPASSPYTTGVGGTSLFVDANYNYAFENVWGDFSTKEKEFVVGATGGISRFYQAPPWQDSIRSFYAGGYGYINDATNNAICGTESNKACRAVPDISMLADPNTGLNIIVNGVYENNYGGTSLACPLYSATVLLINQARALLNKSRIGQTAPYLYQMNYILRLKRGLNLIVPPVNVLNGATAPDPKTYPMAPSTSFILTDKEGKETTNIWGWDSSLTIAPETQFWNDAVGVGSPNLPNFVPLMASL